MALFKLHSLWSGAHLIKCPVIRPFGERLLHNLSANTCDKVPSPSGVAPIVIMHGLFGTKKNWGSICKALNAYSSPIRKVIAIDARNHGDSPHVSSHTYEDLAQDVHDFLRAQDIPKAVVIGHSMGGRAMMTFAYKYPEMVEKAIIVDISPVRSSPLLTSMNIIFESMLTVSVPDDLDMRAARKLADSQLKKIITNDETRGFIMLNFVKHPDGKYGWKANVATLSEYFLEHISRFPPDLAARSCAVPTLFVAGNNSDFVSPDELPAIQKLFPNSSLVFLDSGHLVHIERPQELLKLVLGFIDQPSR